jgi:hypothetical protein
MYKIQTKVTPLNVTDSSSSKSTKHLEQQAIQIEHHNAATTISSTLNTPHRAGLHIYVIDNHQSIYTMLELADACSTQLQCPYLYFFYNTDSEQYTFLEESYANLERYIPVKHHLSLYEHTDNGDRSSFPPSLIALCEFIDGIIRHLAKHKVAITHTKLCCPANLGRPRTSIMTEDTDCLLSALMPDEVLFITDSASTFAEDDKKQYDIEDDVTLYTQRNLTRMGYRISNKIRYADYIHRTTIESALSKKAADILKLNSKFDKPTLLTPPIAYAQDTLAIYIVTTHLTGAHTRLATICSSAQHEPNLFALYRSEDQSFEVMQIHTIPSKKPEKRRAHIDNINLCPAGRLSYWHFAQFIQVLKGEEYLQYKKIRLYIEATLGGKFNNEVSTLTNTLIHKLHPSYLGLITTPQSHFDTQTYLSRQQAKQGFLLPSKKIEGNAIPIAMIAACLYHTDHPRSPAFTLHDMLTLNLDEADALDPFHHLRQYLHTNIIPTTAARTQEAELTPREPDEIGSSNKSLSDTKTLPEPVEQQIQINEPAHEEIQSSACCIVS